MSKILSWPRPQPGSQTTGSTTYVILTHARVLSLPIPAGKARSCAVQSDTSNGHVQAKHCHSPSARVSLTILATRCTHKLQAPTCVAGHYNGPLKYVCLYGTWWFLRQQGMYFNTNLPGGLPENDFVLLFGLSSEAKVVAPQP
jgi:hypothetical protein